MGEWRKRYLILKGSKLFFATNMSTAPHGMIDLVDCVSVKTADAKTGKQYALEVILKNESVFMVAKTQEERDLWLGQIGRAIVSHSSLFVDNGYDDEDDDDEEEGASGVGATAADHM